MSSFEIDLSTNKGICINLECIYCRRKFSTELDTNFTEVQSPYSNEDRLYCTECEKPYECSIKVNLNKFEIIFKDNLKGSISYSGNVNQDEYNESTPYQSKQFYHIQIDRLKKILNVEIEQYITDQALNRLVFSGVITALETYLNEIFISIVFESEYTLEKFVSEYEPYKKEQISLNKIFSKYNSLGARVREDLNYLIYHNIGKLIAVFDIFNFDLQKFPRIKDISIAIQKRHDLVHRNGLDKDNNFQEISKAEVRALISNTSQLVGYIDKKIKERCYLSEEFLF